VRLLSPACLVVLTLDAGSGLIMIAYFFTGSQGQCMCRLLDEQCLLLLRVCMCMTGPCPE
jgi:hypothetical protein